MTEYFDTRRMTVSKTRLWTAVAREAYSPDRLVAWTGRRTNPGRFWSQGSLETRSEFYDRVSDEISSS